jgi:hypothetical protein
MKARGQIWEELFRPWGRRRGLVASMLVLVAVALIASGAMSIRSLRGELIGRVDAEMAADAERARTLAALGDYDTDVTIEVSIERSSRTSASTRW